MLHIELCHASCVEVGCLGKDVVRFHWAVIARKRQVQGIRALPEGKKESKGPKESSCCHFQSRLNLSCEPILHVQKRKRTKPAIGQVTEVYIKQTMLHQTQIPVTNRPLALPYDVRIVNGCSGGGPGTAWSSNRPGLKGK